MNFIDQRALTVIADVNPAKIDFLRKTLEEIQTHVETNSILPFAQLKGVHFCRFVVLPAFTDRQGNKVPDQLVYAANFDESLEQHLTNISKAGVIKGFVTLFSCCKDFEFTSPSSQVLTEFVRKHEHKVHTFYRGHRGMSADLILYERKIYEDIKTFLHDNVLEEQTPAQIKDKIDNCIAGARGWKAVPQIKLPFLSIAVLAIVILAILISPLVLAMIIGSALGYFWNTLIILGLIILSAVLYLRHLEKNADQLSETDVDYENVKDLTSREDILIQNQLTHLVELRPGLFRRVLQRFGLWVIQLLATYTYNKGRLGDIGTIHFARWSMIDQGRRLLFFSNFDGSWENYLGDFVDRAALGLTLAWSNTKKFPKARYLAFGGATDEARFKAWTRNYQIPTQVWYSAYKNLTVKNVLKNHRIALGIAKKMNSKEIDEWLKLL